MCPSCRRLEIDKYSGPNIAVLQINTQGEDGGGDVPAAGGGGGGSAGINDDEQQRSSVATTSTNDQQYPDISGLQQCECCTKP